MPYASNANPAYQDQELMRAAQTAFSRQRVLVVGDAILDCYRTADGRSRCFAGGAAVIAAHLKQLGADPVLVTLTAQDGNAAKLGQCLDALRLDSRRLPRLATLPIRVRKVIGQTITALPHHEHHVGPPTPQTLAQLVEVIQGVQAGCDAAIFADFGYGAVSPALLDALLSTLRRDIPVLTGDVSGPRASLLAMRRFDLLTPTEAELRRLTPSPTPTPPLEAVGRRMQTELDLQHLLVTRDRQGCVRFDADGTVRALPSPAPTVVDEVGAGDALLAVATLCLAAGFTIDQTTRLGQRAAAAALAQIGNAPLDWPRLQAGGRPVVRVPSTGRPTSPARPAA